MSLRGVFVERRALIFLGIWLVTNFIFGAGAQTFGLSDAPVAWVAHVGGFFAGLLLFPLFDRPFRAASDDWGACAQTRRLIETRQLRRFPDVALKIRYAGSELQSRGRACDGGHPRRPNGSGGK